jgi:hypothetical protein
LRVAPQHPVYQLFGARLPALLDELTDTLVA